MRRLSAARFKSSPFYRRIVVMGVPVGVIIGILIAFYLIPQSITLFQLRICVGIVVILTYVDLALSIIIGNATFKGVPVYDRKDDPFFFWLFIVLNLIVAATLSVGAGIALS